MGRYEAQGASWWARVGQTTAERARALWAWTARARKALAGFLAAALATALDELLSGRAALTRDGVRDALLAGVLTAAAVYVVPNRSGTPRPHDPTLRA